MAVVLPFSNPQDAAEHFKYDLIRVLSKSRAITAEGWDEGQLKSSSIEDVIQSCAHTLRKKSHLDADALDEIHGKLTSSPSFGGLGIQRDTIPTSEQYDEILFQTEAYLESVNSQINARDYTHVRRDSAQGARPMTLAEKIFVQHALSGISPGDSSLVPGDVIRAGVDWVLASELAWAHMSEVMKEVGDPGIWRNDRFWLAGDHVVHPDVLDQPRIKYFIERSEKAKRDFKMTQYQGMNYTIMHTQFVRERAQPGMLCIGADSHTCSAGAVGCLSIGLGAADVMMTLALGETWFKCPESVSIEFIGKPSLTTSGKDIILHILGELKRNTVAAERIVEFSGEGAQYLSVDSRFAICNMGTEFGAITAMFVPDAVTQDYIDRRKTKANRSSAVYFKPDRDAVYASKHTIDLSKVESTIAVYPEPDHIVPISEKAGMHLDGVFIGACTTTEEELVLAALVLKAGLEKKLPLAKGQRHYVPGSLPIVEKLRELGLLEIYEAAGFTRGPPGCSMCVGLSAEKASEGEVWLSSQNRNFQNRMGKGAIGNLSSAAVCAASAFSMTVTDPAELIKNLDVDFFTKYKGAAGHDLPAPTYVEPQPPKASPTVRLSNTTPSSTKDALPNHISSKIITLGDFIDTDALAPGFTLTSCHTEEEFGQHVLCYTHPDFRDKVKNDHRIVVAGRGFGVGSSRDVAVSALKGAGVQAVIARGFAFIYGRNQPSLGLLGFTMDDEEFYKLAEEGAGCEIDVPSRTVKVGGKEFAFKLSAIEEGLMRNEGITGAFMKFGKQMWENLTEAKEAVKEGKPEGDKRLEW